MTTKPMKTLELHYPMKQFFFCYNHYKAYYIFCSLYLFVCSFFSDLISLTFSCSISNYKVLTDVNVDSSSLPLQEIDG